MVRKWPCQAGPSSCSGTYRSVPAHYGDIVRDPAAIGHAVLLGFALADGCFPKVDPFESVEAVGLAPLSAEQLARLACIRDRGHGAEPCRDVTLDLRA